MAYENLYHRLQIQNRILLAWLRYLTEINSALTIQLQF